MCSACELPDGHAESRVEDRNPPDGEGEVFCGVYFDAQEDKRIRVGRALTIRPDNCAIAVAELCALKRNAARQRA